MKATLTTVLNLVLAAAALLILLIIGAIIYSVFIADKIDQGSLASYTRVVSTVEQLTKSQLKLDYRVIPFSIIKDYSLVGVDRQALIDSPPSLLQTETVRANDTGCTSSCICLMQESKVKKCSKLNAGVFLIGPLMTCANDEEIGRARRSLLDPNGYGTTYMALNGFKVIRLYVEKFVDDTGVYIFVIPIKESDDGCGMTEEELESRRLSFS